MFYSIATILILALGLAGTAQAHSFYSTRCCNEKDCRPIPRSDVKETGKGYLLKFNGETIPYNSDKLRDSPDGEYHWCECKFCSQSNTRCLYRPPGAV